QRTPMDASAAPPLHPPGLVSNPRGGSTMKKLLTGFCVVALGVGMMAGCTERTDRVTERERVTPAPSASPDTTTRSESTTTTTAPRSAAGVRLLRRAGAHVGPEPRSGLDEVELVQHHQVSERSAPARSRRGALPRVIRRRATSAPAAYRPFARGPLAPAPRVR